MRGRSGHRVGVEWSWGLGDAVNSGILGACLLPFEVNVPVGMVPEVVAK